MDVDTAMRIESGEQTAQDALVALQIEVERLHTWDGLMSILDEHYPPDVFVGGSADPGPRLIALMREVERLRAMERRARTVAQAGAHEAIRDAASWILRPL